jgi:hypothetical protein
MTMTGNTDFTRRYNYVSIPGEPLDRRILDGTTSTENQVRTARTKARERCEGSGESYSVEISFSQRLSFRSVFCKTSRFSSTTGGWLGLTRSLNLKIVPWGSAFLASIFPP